MTTWTGPLSLSLFLFYRMFQNSPSFIGHCCCQDHTMPLSFSSGLIRRLVVSVAASSYPFVTCQFPLISLTLLLNNIGNIHCVEKNNSV